MIHRIALKLLFICALALPSVAWTDEIQDRLNVALQVIPEHEHAPSFIEGFLSLRETQRLDFLERFEELSPEDRSFAVAIYIGGLPDAEDERSRTRLLRGAIMIPDIRENVIFVVENGYIREEADGTRESTNILRFLEIVIEDYPRLAADLFSKEFMLETRALYSAGVAAIRERGERIDAEIAEMEALIVQMDSLIVRMETLVVR